MHHEANESALVPTIVSRRRRRHVVVHGAEAGTPAGAAEVGRWWWFPLVDAQAAAERWRRKRR
jgi:hypothetical protein